MVGPSREYGRVERSHFPLACCSYRARVLLAELSPLAGASVDVHVEMGAFFSRHFLVRMGSGDSSVDVLARQMLGSLEFTLAVHLTQVKPMAGNEGEAEVQCW